MEVQQSDHGFLLVQLRFPTFSFSMEQSFIQILYDEK